MQDRILINEVNEGTALLPLKNVVKPEIFFMADDLESHLLALPPEIIFSILRWLPYHDLLTMRETAKEVQNIVDDFPLRLNKDEAIPLGLQDVRHQSPVTFGRMFSESKALSPHLPELLNARKVLSQAVAKQRTADNMHRCFSWSGLGYVVGFGATPWCGFIPAIGMKAFLASGGFFAATLLNIIPIYVSDRFNKKFIRNIAEAEENYQRFFTLDRQHFRDHEVTDEAVRLKSFIAQF